MLFVIVTINHAPTKRVSSKPSIGRTKFKSLYSTMLHSIYEMSKQDHS